MSWKVEAFVGIVAVLYILWLDSLLRGNRTLLWELYLIPGIISTVMDPDGQSLEHRPTLKLIAQVLFGAFIILAVYIHFWRWG